MLLQLVLDDRDHIDDSLLKPKFVLVEAGVDLAAIYRLEDDVDHFIFCVPSFEYLGQFVEEIDSDGVNGFIHEEG